MGTGDSRASSGVIAGSVIVTVVWGVFVFFLTLIYSMDAWWLGPRLCLSVVAALIYSLVHPIIGKIWAAAALALCRAIDRIFEPDEPWGDWSLDRQMIFASLWPITGLPTVIFTAIGVVFGFMFRVLFR